MIIQSIHFMEARWGATIQKIIRLKGIKCVVMIVTINLIPYSIFGLVENILTSYGIWGKFRRFDVRNVHQFFITNCINLEKNINNFMQQLEMRIFFSNQWLNTYIYCNIMFTKYQNSPDIYMINKTNKDLQILKVEIMNFSSWFLFFQDSKTIFHTCNWISLLLKKNYCRIILLLLLNSI